MNLLEIFIITNERSTFPWTLKSVEAQTVTVPVTVIKNMKWVDALKKCSADSKSKFYMRVDDDMFLHPKAIEYYVRRLQKGIKSLGVYECKLWEDLTHKPAGSLKAYKTKVTRKIGFKPNHLGKVDKVFAKKLEKHGYRRIRDKSMIGLHSCSTIEDQERYRDLWKKENNITISSSEFAKTFDNIIHIPHKSVEDQYKDISKLKKLNRKYSTKFYKLLKD